MEQLPTNEQITEAKTLLITAHRHYIDSVNRGQADGKPPLDFTGEDLRYAVFEGADLSSSRLGRTKLHKADFSGADFRQANLRGADLAVISLAGARVPARFRVSDTDRTR
jgi:uncharacterized protein YjbI with pentapeptide repeats